VLFRSGAVLQNTSASVNIKERLDFSCALFDASGNLIANAPHIPVHLGSMGESVQALIQAQELNFQPGDVYATNHPYRGGTHLPDITVVTPVYIPRSSQPNFYVASRGHHGDLGGITPGSMPPFSTQLAEEGILFENLLLLRAGQFQEQTILNLLHSGPFPARNPQQNLADLQAQIAANACGVAQLQHLVNIHSLGVVQAYMGHVQDYGEAAVRQKLRQLATTLPNPASFRYPMDDGLLIQVQVVLDGATGSAQIDFTGTSDQQPNNFNAPMAVTKAAILYVLRTLVDQDIPLNSGCLRPIELVIPQGCLLNPGEPGAVVAGNVETSQAVTNALYGALGVMAAAQGTMNNLTLGDAQYQYYETICGGSGAGPGFRGTDGVQTHMTNSRLTDPEVLESRFPVLLEEFKIRPGSGGQGQFRGGNGVVRRLRFLRPMTAALLSGHRIVPPPGLAGGDPGQVGNNLILRAAGSVEQLGGRAEVAMEIGDSLVIATPGGGGYGLVSTDPKHLPT